MVVLFVALLSVGGYFVIDRIIPQSQHNKAKDFIDNHNYDEAIDILSKNPEFSNNEYLIEQCNYLKAEDYAKNREYDKAFEQLKKIVIDYENISSYEKEYIDNIVRIMIDNKDNNEAQSRMSAIFGEIYNFNDIVVENKQSLEDDIKKLVEKYEDTIYLYGLAKANVSTSEFNDIEAYSKSRCLGTIWLARYCQYGDGKYEMEAYDLLKKTFFEVVSDIRFNLDNFNSVLDLMIEKEDYISVNIEEFEQSLLNGRWKSKSLISSFVYHIFNDDGTFTEEYIDTGKVSNYEWCIEDDYIKIKYNKYKKIFKFNENFYLLSENPKYAYQWGDVLFARD